MNLAERLDALARAADLADGRSDVAAARRVVNQSTGRLAITTDQTVVALAGATGSGKSSLFNALSGTTLAEAGVLRPTTAVALAASFDTDATELLDWLDIGRRQEVRGAAKRLTNLVLVDLPDHDSTEASHRGEVDRLTQVVDQLMFVVDPQKYADAALHRGYLAKLGDHQQVVRVVLNKIDTLTDDEVRRCVADLRRILDAEGLRNVPVFTVSATTGQGIPALRDELAALVAEKASATARLGSDVQAAAADLAAQLGLAVPDALDKRKAAQLVSTLASAAGADVVAQAAGDATRHRGVLATGWPFVKWVRRLRPDPLRRLRLGDRREDENAPVRVQRSSLPAHSIVQDARVASAVRAMGQDAAAGLPDGWRDAVLAAGRVNSDQLADSLDRAIATTDLGVGRGTGWWKTIQVLQWLLMACVVVGGGWLLANVVLGYFLLPPLPTVSLGPEDGFRVALPTALLLGGALAGLLLGAVSRLLIALAARAASSRARSALMKSVGRVAEAEIIGPLRSELGRHAEAVRALAQITGRR